MGCPACGLEHDLPEADTPLADVLNLGKVNAGWLQEAGLRTFVDLQVMGSVRAWLLMEALGIKPSLNLLYAMEGALHGSHWLEIKRRCKTELLMQLEVSREQGSI
jgi:DNA transformation protein